MDADALLRLEEKLDRNHELLERILRRVEAILPAELPRPRPTKPLIQDPDLARRIHERVRRYEQSGEYERQRRLMSEEDERRGDPDWWARDLLERDERDDRRRAAES